MKYRLTAPVQSKKIKPISYVLAPTTYPEIKLLKAAPMFSHKMMIAKATPKRFDPSVNVFVILITAIPFVPAPKPSRNCVAIIAYGLDHQRRKIMIIKTRGTRAPKPNVSICDIDTKQNN